MRQILARLRDRFRRDQLDCELDDEMRFHRERLERDARAQGMSEADARIFASRQLGNDTRMRESTRDQWSFQWIDNIAHDLRYAWRGMRRSPAFSVTAIITLALAIGANTSMFGVIDQLMYRPFPYLRDPSAVHRVYLQTTSRGKVNTNYTIPYARYLDFKQGTTSFEQYGAFSERLVAVGLGEESAEQRVVGVSGSFFSFFNVSPERGRFIDENDDAVPRGADVVVLSHAFWESHYGRADVIGKLVRIGSLDYRVIGIAPKGFTGVTQNPSPIAFIPITTVPANEERGSNITRYYTTYSWDFTVVMVRRKADVTESVASQDLTRAYVASRDKQRIAMPTVVAANIARPRAFAGALKVGAGPGSGIESQTLLWVSGVAVIVLLIACANVANLMFARILRRRREFAMRLALGVGRARLMQQLLTESLLLSIIGSAAGIVIAQTLGTRLGAMVMQQSGDSLQIVDWRTLGIAALLATLTSVITAVAPALLVVRGNLAATLRAGAREGTYQRSSLRTALLVAQGAMSVVLLVGAGLFVRSLHNVNSYPLGYDASRLLLVQTNMRGITMDSIAERPFREQLVDVARNIPGVAGVARVDMRPFATSMTLIDVPGVDSANALGRFSIQHSTPDYFRVMNTRIVQGRAFTDADRQGTELVEVVSQAMARALWPNENAIGKCIRIGDSRRPPEQSPCTTVIGVAEDAAYDALGSQSDNRKFVHYLPVAQAPNGYGNKMLIRIANPEQSSERVRIELQKAMPGQSYITVTPFINIIDTQRRSWQLGSMMFVAFGALALVIAAVGLYGVIAYNVAQRMHELGVRVALGAQSRHIISLVVGQGVAFAVAGVTIGLALSLVAARWIQPLMFRQSARDPLTLAVVGATLITVALVASAIPAMRAARADPNAALRGD